MPRGLGLYQVLAKFLDGFVHRASTLIFLMNFSEDELTEIQQLKAHNDIPVVNISAELAPKRTKMYLTGGIYAVSKWVILLDLLSANQLPISVVSGMIINNVEDTDGIYDRECWATTLLKMDNQKAFI